MFIEDLVHSYLRLMNSCKALCRHKHAMKDVMNPFQTEWKTRTRGHEWDTSITASLNRAFQANHSFSSFQNLPNASPSKSKVHRIKVCSKHLIFKSRLFISLSEEQQRTIDFKVLATYQEVNLWWVNLG